MSKAVLNWKDLASFILLTAQKMKFSIKDIFSKFDQIRKNLRIWSHLLKKFLMENFIFKQRLLLLGTKTLTSFFNPNVTKKFRSKLSLRYFRMRRSEQLLKHS